MTKREQIIEILKEYMDMEWEECADAILALPIDVPTEEEINLQYHFGNNQNNENRIIGAKWAINEILKRNQ